MILAQASIDGREQTEGRPVEVGPPMSNHPDEAVVDEAGGRHRHSRSLGLGEREPEVLDGQRRGQSRRAVALIDDFPAVSLMDLRVEQRICQHIIGEVAIHPAFPQQSQHLTHAFECRRGQHIGGEFGEVGQCRLFAE